MFTFGITAQQKTINLQQAIQSEMVHYKARGNESSAHYHQPILLELENRTNTPLSIRIENGLKFHSNSDDIQDLILTQEELLVLESGETKVIPLNAMCIQKNFSAANAEETYKLGERATGNMLALCKEIEKKGYQDTLGQYAIWTLTDDMGLNSIIGYEGEKAFELKDFMASLLGIEVPEYAPEQMEDYQLIEHTEYRVPVPEESGPVVTTRTTTGYFEYKFSKERAITIAMFDAENRLIRELYNNPSESPESHRIEFDFKMEIDPTQKYYVRLLADNEIQMSLTMKARQG